MEQQLEHKVQNEVQLVAKPIKNLITTREGFPKGKSANPLGRPKGAISVKTKIIKLMMDDVISGGGTRFKNEMKKLKGKEYVQAYLAACEFCIPKLARVESTGNEQEITITQIFKIGDQEISL